MNNTRCFFMVLLLLGSNTIFCQQNPYRDLNKNGKRDVYENPTVSSQERAKDLVGKMTLAEKIGAIFITYAFVEKDGSISNQTMMTSGKKVDSLIKHNLMTHFNIVAMTPLKATAIARYNNTIQKIAEKTRLGIPITISSDPRHSAKQTDNVTAAEAGDFTPFPEPIGFGAIGDPVIMKKFAAIAAQEYRAVGISCALHPMADLATEPRWSRISGSFGENELLSEKLIKSYIQGFQGDQLSSNSVMCITKHFPGSGPQKEGWEGHFSYGKSLIYPGNNFDAHLSPFKAAIATHTAGIMVAYGIPTAQTNEDVGSCFNKDLLQNLLKTKLGYEGIVVADWNTITAKYIGNTKLFEARGWGVENLTTKEKLIKEIEAGVDQIGGEIETENLIALVKSGEISQKLIDASVLKIMKLKFELGLFDNPYVDETKISEKVGTPENVDFGLKTQQKSLVLLKNNAVLPLNKNVKIYVEGCNKTIAAQYAQVVDDIEKADFAIFHLSTPYSPPKENGLLEKSFHQGKLDFDSSLIEKIAPKLKLVPSIVIVNLERPAVLTPFNTDAAALMVDFTVNEKVIFQTLFGETAPTGKLPFELPSSMENVMLQKEDLPSDSKDPLYKFGFGIQGY